MANSVVTVTITNTDVCGKTFRVFGTIGIAAGDYPANGLTLKLNDPLIKATRAPLFVQIQGQQKVNSQTQYDYSYVPGADLASGKLKIFTGGAEASTTTPTGVVNDTIQFIAHFLGML